MDNAHNKHGPVSGPVCRVQDSREAPPGVIEQPGINKPRDEVTTGEWGKIPMALRDLITHRPRDSAARSRAPDRWRTVPGKPALGPVTGEVRPVVNEIFELQITDYQRFKFVKIQEKSQTDQKLIETDSEGSHTYIRGWLPIEKANQFQTTKRNQ